MISLSLCASLSLSLCTLDHPSVALSQHLGRQALAAQIAADNDESADLLEDMPAPLGPLNKVWHEAEGCEGLRVVYANSDYLLVFLLLLLLFLG